MAIVWKRDGRNMLSERELLERRYQTARTTLLAIFSLTLANVLALVLNFDFSLPFSAAIPYALVFYGRVLGGMMSEEFYAETLPGFEPLGNSAFAWMLTLALLALAVYFLGWMLSRHHRATWLIATFVFFALDTLALFLLALSPTSIIDLVFHIWILVCLVRGIRAHAKWKELPKEEETEE